MTKLKVLFVRNGNYSEKVMKRDEGYLKALFLKDFPKFHKVPALDIQVDYLKTDINVDLRKLRSTDKYYYVYGVKPKLETLVEEGVYNAVFFYFTTKRGKRSKNSTSYTPIHNKSVFVKMTDRKNIFTVTHEMMHSLFHMLKKQKIKGIFDSMDRMQVNGAWKDYYKNNSPLHPEGNYARSFLNLKPHFKEFGGMLNKKTTVKEVKPNKTTAPSGYKYFKSHEIIGLQSELVKLLDKARGHAGIPFAITSGFRTVKQNSKIKGASKNSEHLYGLAADIRVRNGTERKKVIEAGLKAGFRRIGVAKDFVHLGIGTKGYAQDVIWTY